MLDSVAPWQSGTSLASQAANVSLPLSTGLGTGPESGVRQAEGIGLDCDTAEPGRSLIEAEGRLMLEYEDDGLIMSQIRAADFARMSTSKQLSLWAILRAQLSSKKHLAALASPPAQRTVPASPAK